MRENVVLTILVTLFIVLTSNFLQAMPEEATGSNIPIIMAERKDLSGQITTYGFREKFTETEGEIIENTLASVPGIDTVSVRGYSLIVIKGVAFSWSEIDPSVQGYFSRLKGKNIPLRIQKGWTDGEVLTVLKREGVIIQ